VSGRQFRPWTRHRIGGPARLELADLSTLACAARAGDASARERLILAMLPVAWSVASKFCRRFGGKQTETDQTAALILIRAVNYLDPDRRPGSKFAPVAYLYRCIAGALIHDRRIRWRRERLFEALADPDDIFDWPDDRPDRRHEDDAAEEVGRLLPVLERRERDIIAARFGLDGRDEETLTGIGRRIGLTRERVRQIEQGALNRLRMAARGETPPRRRSDFGAKPKPSWNGSGRADPFRQLDPYLAGLDRLEREVLAARSTRPKVTLYALGRRLGLSTFRISQIERRARAKLRQFSNMEANV
jgi:RNA polymerase sigma factor (sigma-70 family)